MNRSNFQSSQVGCLCFNYYIVPLSLHQNRSDNSLNIYQNSYKQERQSIKTGRLWQGKKSLRRQAKTQFSKLLTTKPSSTHQLHQQDNSGFLRNQKNKKCFTFFQPVETPSAFSKQNKISIFQEQQKLQKNLMKKDESFREILQKIQNKSLKLKESTLITENAREQVKIKPKITKRASISRFVIFLNQPKQKQNKFVIENENLPPKKSDKKVMFGDLLGQKINLSALKMSLRQLQSVYQDETSAVQSMVLQKGKSTWVAPSRKKLGITQFISSLHIRQRRQSRSTQIGRRPSRLSPKARMDEI